MSEQKLGLTTIPGIQDLNNLEAEIFVGGAFSVNRYLNSGTNNQLISGNFTRISLNQSLNGFDLENRSVLEGETFTLVYRNNAGTEVDREEIFGAGRPRLYTGGRHLTNGRSVVHVDVTQNAAPGPSVSRPSAFSPFGAGSIF